MLYIPLPLPEGPDFIWVFYPIGLSLGWGWGSCSFFILSCVYCAYTCVYCVCTCVYWVHTCVYCRHTCVYSIQLEGQKNRPTLYSPKSPKSCSTFRALTLGPVVISPATCRRIFTISRGLVKMTCEPPACKQGRQTSSFHVRAGLGVSVKRKAWKTSLSCPGGRGGARFARCETSSRRCSKDASC